MATAGLLPFDRMHGVGVEMEEGDGTKMQQLHGKVRTPKKLGPSKYKVHKYFWIFVRKMYAGCPQILW